MQTLENILVVVGDDADEARIVFEKAGALAVASGAAVHAVRVVYEGIADLSAGAIDAATDLKSFILQAEETVTEDLAERARETLPKLECATLWNPRPWEAILHAAEQTEADLIIKCASLHPRLGEIVRTPDDWNLLRGASVPVMLVKPRAWVEAPAILAAVDAFDEAHDDLNRALLVEGGALAQILGGDLHVVAAYPLFERWVGELGGLRDYADLKKDVEREIRDRLVDLAGRCGVTYRQLYADEGRADSVIADLAEQLDAEIVVVGTQARHGLKGMLLGNTSERLVHELATDVVTVHAPGTGS